MKRDEFIKQAISNPEEAAKYLRAQAKKLSQSKKVTSTAKILSEALFVSDRTVYRDCKK